MSGKFRGAPDGSSPAMALVGPDGKVLATFTEAEAERVRVEGGWLRERVEPDPADPRQIVERWWDAKTGRLKLELDADDLDA